MILAPEQWLLFVAAGLVLNLTPGPDVLFIVTRSLRSGLRAGLVAACGISGGCFVHIAAAALGIGALLATSATAFTVLKWVGAAYLVYLGVRMLFARDAALPAQLVGKPGAGTGVGEAVPGAPGALSPAAPSLRAIFWSGFATNALNPKVALFFLAFLPQFIGPAVENKTVAFLLLGLVFNLNALWVGWLWALGASALARRMAVVRQGLAWLERGAGALFVGFGLRLAFSDNPTR